MSRHKRCLNFQWRDEDPAWRAERDNDRIVFRKIRKMTIGGLSADRVIAALFRSDPRSPRLEAARIRGNEDEAKRMEAMLGEFVSKALEIE